MTLNFREVLQRVCLKSSCGEFFKQPDSSWLSEDPPDRRREEVLSRVLFSCSNGDLVAKTPCENCMESWLWTFFRDFHASQEVADNFKPTDINIVFFTTKFIFFFPPCFTCEKWGGMYGRLMSRTVVNTAQVCRLLKFILMTLKRGKHWQTVKFAGYLWTCVVCCCLEWPISLSLFWAIKNVGTFPLLIVWFYNSRM